MFCCPPCGIQIQIQEHAENILLCWILFPSNIFRRYVKLLLHEVIGTSCSDITT